MLAAPPTRYARSGDARIAFQVMGEGPPDAVFVGGPASHLDVQWEDPETVRGRQRFASFARVVSFDRRGTGLSDPGDRPPTLDQQMDDLDAVLDAAAYCPRSACRRSCCTGATIRSYRWRRGARRRR